MKKRIIEEYNLIEKEKGEKIAGKLLSKEHLISNPCALYPEYTGLRKSCGLHRPGVNLGCMWFLFPKVITYVHPMKKDDFPKRYGIDFETFMFLSDPSLEPYRFIYPVLNHPKYYIDKTVRTELSSLLKRFPPTWERWHQALRITGGTYWFDLCDSLVNYKNILSKSDIRAKGQKDLLYKSNEFINKEVIQQIRNKFTDLCIIGEQERAKKLALLSSLDPHLFIADLSYISEFLAYSQVLGAGGNLNFISIEPEKYLQLLKQDNKSKELLSKIFDGKIIDTLLSGLKFYRIPRVFQLDFLLDWHKYDMASKVREVYQKILNLANSDNPNLSEFNQDLKTIVSSLQTFCKSSYSNSKYVGKIVKERQTNFVKTCTFGGILLGLFGLISPLALYAFFEATSVALIGFYYKTNRIRVEKQLIKKYFPELSYDLIQSVEKIKQFRVKTLIKLVNSENDLLNISKIISKYNTTSTFWLIRND